MAAVELQGKLWREHGIEVSLTSLKRKARKAARRNKQTNGHARPSHQWPRKSHDFDRCRDCRRAQGKA